MRPPEWVAPALLPQRSLSPPPSPTPVTPGVTLERLVVLTRGLGCRRERVPAPGLQVWGGEARRPGGRTYHSRAPRRGRRHPTLRAEWAGAAAGEEGTRLGPETGHPRGRRPHTRSGRQGPQFPGVFSLRSPQNPHCNSQDEQTPGTSKSDRQRVDAGSPTPNSWKSHRNAFSLMCHSLN